MTECKVWLHNGTGEYKAGEQMLGKVELNFRTKTELRALKVRLVCHEHTEWMGKESKSRTNLFKGNNDAFSTELILYGGPSGTTSLRRGQHFYHFNITLPHNLPGTFYCENGYINYRIKAIVDRPMAEDYEDQIIFTIVPSIDLNNLGRPELLETTTYSEEKIISSLWCVDGPISLDVELPKRTLIPGDTVIVVARLSNLSSIKIQHVELKLKQIITCRVEEPSREEETVDNLLVEIPKFGLGAHGEHTYTFSVKLPMDFTIPNFVLCKLFKAEYKCTVTAKLPGAHNNLEVDMYLEIGNIDIGSQINQSSESQVPVPLPTSDSPPSYRNAGQYPPAPGTGGDEYKPAIGFNVRPIGVSVYSPSAPSAPPSDYFAESQEAAGFSSGHPYSDQPPPSYESIQKSK